MSLPAAVRRVLAAARRSGAGEAEVYHRRSRTRLLALAPAGVELSAERTEEGMALRVWPSGAGDGPCGFAAASAGEDPERLARLAVAAMAAPGMQPAGEEQRAASAAEGAEPATEASVPVFDPDLLRLTLPEMRRLLAPFLEGCDLARRPGVPWSPRALLRVAVVDTLLVRRDGAARTSRATLAAMQIRFPSAFGLARLEGVSRRLSDLRPAPLVPLLAAYPVPAGPPAWLAVDPARQGEDDLLLAPPVVATLAASAARRAVAAGRPLAWGSTAVLADEPLLPWGPGTSPWDGEGDAPGRHLLGATAARASTSPAAVFSSQRLSYREPPRQSPSNLTLSGLSSGARATARRRLHLLEVAVDGGMRVAARGVLRQEGADDRPVLVHLRCGLEDLLGEDARAGAVPGLFFPAGGYVAAPELLVPGVRLESS